jgi:Ca2+-binding EF-hand superfamily protein
MKSFRFVVSLAAMLAALPASAQPPSPSRPAFDGADTNADGQITAEEFSQNQVKRFKSLDVDGDGFLTPADRASAGAARLAGRRGNNGGELLARLDADGDKKVSQTEFNTATQARFAKADADHNASVSLAELQALAPLGR